MTQGQRLSAIMADHDRGDEYAIVECIGDDFSCPETERVEGTLLLTTEQIVSILSERGWSVSPTLCPKHQGAGR